MIPLHRCESCGFLSTRGDAYRYMQRLRFCHNCADRYDAGLEPVATWVREKLERQEERA